MKGALVIIPVGNGAVTRKELTAPPRLEDLQAGVGGDIEAVPFFTCYEGKQAAAFCNEHGKLEGLPVNQRATVLWFRQLSRHPDDYLVGPVVIVAGDRSLMRKL